MSNFSTYILFSQLRELECRILRKDFLYKIKVYNLLLISVPMFPSFLGFMGRF